MSLETDQKFMQVALGLARRGLGQTSPNPSVGAVIVKKIPDPSNAPDAAPASNKYQIIARAVTGKGGTPHGEPLAIALANNAAQNDKGSLNTYGTTLYVTLEPCNHHGRTPPCTEAIIAAGIKRVVIASPDPDARVTGGQGVARLRAAGIEVITGVCQKQADELNAGHISRQTKNRPFIILKSAISSDGMVSPASQKIRDGDTQSQKNKSQPVWVTSPLARQRGHLLRAEVDAILIGSHTALADNPSLTCRLPGMQHRSPQPIILDTGLNLPADLAIFHPSISLAPWVITSTKVSPLKLTAYQLRNVKIIQIDEDQNKRIDLIKLTSHLSDVGITRMLIEGGPTIAKNVLEQGLVDQINVFKGANPAGHGAILPYIDHPASWPVEKLGFQQSHSQKLQDNMMFQYNLS